jgi:tetratricopeptide (TPR) repeat protein
MGNNETRTSTPACGSESGCSLRPSPAPALFALLSETPDRTAALIGLAYVHLDRGKFQQAIGFFQRALDQDRENASAVFGLAESHRQKGNRRAALAEFKKFLTLQSTGDEADMARRLVQELENDGA